MKRKRYTDELIGFVLRHAEAMIPIAEVCRKMGISEQTFDRWKKQFAWLATQRLRIRTMAGPGASCRVACATGERFVF